MRKWAVRPRALKEAEAIAARARALIDLQRMQAEREDAGKTYEELMAQHAGVSSQEEALASGGSSGKAHSQSCPMDFQA